MKRDFEMKEDVEIENAAELWQRAVKTYMSSLQSGDNREDVERLLSMVSKVELDNDTFTVKVKNSFACDRLNKEYGVLLKNCLLIVRSGMPTKLNFKVDPEYKAEIVVPAIPLAESAQKRHRLVNFISTMPLTDNYTFDEFVQGPSNSWAYAAAKSVVNHPGESNYNPLFIHGGTGLGKTHLMQAIGNEMLKLKPETAVCYLTAETFLNEYVNSLQNNGIQSFREKYRSVDVLLVDDVQFLQKGKQCQDEFFNTFNALVAEKKQIVMTSDVAPKDLVVLEMRLISRFEGGMVQEIESPSYETRLAILQKKAEGMMPPIPQSAIKFIAEHIKSHVRAMEGALGKVRIMTMMDSSIELTDEMLMRLLKDFIEKEKTQKKVSIDEIQSAVAKMYMVTVKQIISPDRSASLVTPRQLAMYITRKYTSKSLPEISKKFDKTHATILHGVKAITSRLEVEPDLKANLEKLISDFGFSSDDKIG